MKRKDQLPEELLWAEGGHASDVVLTTMADGQLEIVPLAVRAHVDACRSCTTQLGHAALLALHTHGEIALVKKTAVKRPLPRVAIVLGLVVAMIGLVPSLLDAPSDAEGARTFATHTAPLALRALGTLGHRLLDPQSTTSLVLTYGTAAILVAMTLFVIRHMPKKEASR